MRAGPPEGNIGTADVELTASGLREIEESVNRGCGLPQTPRAPDQPVISMPRRERRPAPDHGLFTDGDSFMVRRLNGCDPPSRW